MKFKYLFSTVAFVTENKIIDITCKTDVTTPNNQPILFFNINVTPANMVNNGINI
ncbi:hypothetical protein [Tenacibaculum halocynthiae]|uniref:hypothetical protein n=1 Tax=Tenacibaculum halocynthiae TaxID=1254437 RepID=UPI0038B5D6BA